MQGKDSKSFKSWPTAMIESHGDYRAESFLEDYIGGPLYEHQHQMRKLPVLTIEETLERFLRTALPFCKTVQEKINFRKALQEFPEQAQVLQERLIARQQGEMKDSSWMQLWWNTVRAFQMTKEVTISRVDLRMKRLMLDLSICSCRTLFSCF